MFVPFDQLPESSRIWIYQSARPLTSVETQAISSRLHSFIEGWAAHSTPLRASFTILYQQFIVLAADEDVSVASGCSIDESTQAMKEISEQYGLSLFNREAVTFMKNETLVIIPRVELRSAGKAGTWGANSLVFDMTINRVGDLKSRWIVEAGNTWLKRYLDVAIA